MSKSVLTLVVLSLFASPSFAQPIAKPVKVGSPASICTGCYGTNTLGEDNAGKPMYPFSGPLSAHVGRVVDASVTPALQLVGMRTVRAGRFIRTAPATRGSAPPRIYMGMGETLGVYSLDNFFTTTLTKPMIPVNSIVTGWGYGSTRNGFPFETIAPWDAFFYPEKTTTLPKWKIPTADNQDRLWDADYDDRGNVYIAEDEFGWGVLKDNGETGGAHLSGTQTDFSVPKAGEGVPPLDAGTYSIEPSLIFTLKSGNKYYSFISDRRAKSKGTVVYDVTNTAKPVLQSFRVAAGGATHNHIQNWAKNDSARVIALLHGDGKLRIWDYDSLVANSAPKQVFDPPSGGGFADFSFDDKGVLWVATAKTIIRMTSSGGTYNASTLPVYPDSSFTADVMHANAGYLAVSGSYREGPYLPRTVYLYKMEGTGLSLMDTDNFFTKYYHRSPSGYAEAGNECDSKGAIEIVKHGTKTYLIYNTFGIGDVFQLEGSGPSVSATVKSTFGTPNPNSRPTQVGPFPGDILTFRATTSATSPMNVDWNFGNPESQSKNIRAGVTGADITHQFTGLTTSSKVLQPKTVNVVSSTDSTVSDSLTIQLKLPVANIAVKATGEVVSGSGFEVIPGDVFVDASEGSIESHFATWRVGPTNGAIVPVSATPDTEVPAGVTLGAHTVEFSASYGTYDASNFANPTAYVASLAARSYTVKPFVAKINAPTRNGSTVTYTATARHSTNPAFLNATQWTYKWSLTNAAGGETSLKTGVTNIGTIPDFAFATSLRTDDSKVTLTITVAPGTVPVPAYETYSTFVTIDVPVPVIELTNCGNAGNDCSIRATSATGSTSGWQLSWEVKNGSQLVKSGTGNPLGTFKLPSAGNYTVTVTETVFDVTVTQGFVVAQSACGPPPTAFEMSINASCNPCQINETVEFSAQEFHYDVQACDTFSWSFGDGGTASGRTASHKFTSAKTYTVRLTVKNTNNPTGVVFEQPITVNGPIEVCTAPPTNVAFTKNCISGSTCKAGSSILFNARRGSSNLQSCDTATWSFGDGGTATADRPSHTYTTPGTYTVRVTLSNSAGPSKFYEEEIVIAEGTPAGCQGSANETNVSGDFLGNTSGCSSSNSIACLPNETITFSGAFFRYTQQTCDKFEWNFGDGTPVATAKQSNHSFSSVGTYTVTYKVYNSTNTTGVTLPFVVRVGDNAPIKPTPVLAFQSAPSSGAKGTPVTFTVNVTNDVNATGWAWDFGDGTKDITSQVSLVSKTATITHTFTKVGTFPVTVKARNSEDTRGASAPTGQAALLPGIVLTDIPEYKFLVPVATRGPGQNNSAWRTDVQIYNPDTTVSEANPLLLTATFTGKTETLQVIKSTQTYEDFMKIFVGPNGSGSGPVIITVRAKFAPQIWTRTYTETANGTFGQFIPAIRLDTNAGSGNAFGSGKYYMAGLRHDDRFRTNLGFVNPNAQTINATVRVYDDTRLQIGQFTLSLPPFHLDQFPITDAKAVKDLPAGRPFSLQIEVPDGQWLISYASFLDRGSNDPVYVGAVRESELGLTDYSSIVIPGVGHVGEWRSDVTVFNPDTSTVVVDLAYHDQSGAKVGEAKSVQIRAGEFLQYTDLIKQGVFGNLPDSLGVLRVNVSGPFPPAKFPLTFARTYNDKGIGKTFGQGIGGFAAARANVKPNQPALVAGIRSNTNYYTNVGLVNVSTAPATATVKLLDPTSGAEQILQTHTLQPNQSVVSRVTLPSALETGSLKIEVTGANIWAFCSIVDVRTADPEYVAATPLQ